jgi:hypothetical protein
MRKLSLIPTFLLLFVLTGDADTLLKDKIPLKTGYITEDAKNGTINWMSCDRTQSGVFHKADGYSVRYGDNCIEPYANRPPNENEPRPETPNPPPNPKQ